MPEKKQLKHWPQQYGGKVYDSIDDMLSDPEVEAVSVCTSNNTHAEVSIQAMRAGKTCSL